MTPIQTRQRLLSFAFACALTAAPGIPAFAATTADFESVAGAFPGTASGPSTTQFNTREWNSSGDGDHAIIVNDPAHAAINDYLQLIPETGSERNTIAFDRTDPGLYATITVNYDFRFTNNTGTPADGLGMALLNTNNYGTSGDGPNFAQNGAPTNSINIGLDNYNNGAGAGDPSNNHAEIAYNGPANIVPASDLNPTTQINLSNGQWHHATATFEYASAGTLVTLVLTPDVYGSPGTPVVAYDRVLLPGVLPYEARVAFGAGTGGSDAFHDIDNVQADFSLEGRGFNYTPDFSSAVASDFTFNHIGDAAPTGFVTGATTYIRLTAADNDERGSAWVNQKQRVRDGFVSEFTFEFPTTNAGADGMAFVIQNLGTAQNNTETGPDTHALAIEFDSHNNGPANPDDPSGAHVTIWANDTSRHLLATYDLAPDAFFPFSDLSNTGTHDVRVEYVNGLLTVIMDNKTIFNDLAVDLAALGAFDADGKAWLGFTSRTGGLNEEHNILAWSFVSAIPEPTSFAMLALAGLGVATRRRNRIA